MLGIYLVVIAMGVLLLLTVVFVSVWLVLMFMSKSPHDAADNAQHTPFAAQAMVEVHEPIHHSTDYVLVQAADGTYYSTNGQPVLLATALAHVQLPRHDNVAAGRRAGRTDNSLDMTKDDNDEEGATVYVDAEIAYGRAQYMTEANAAVVSANDCAANYYGADDNAAEHRHTP